MTPADNIEPRFLVALSFPGEKRDYVQKVADCLSSVIGRERVFYDKYYEAELARRNLDTYLQEIYKDKSALVVPFFCQDYEEKEWCDVEWRAIRDTLKTCQNDEKLMGMRFDNTPIKGFLGLDGYIQIGDRHPEVIADLILERLRIMRLISRTPGNPTNSCFCIHNLPFPSIGKLLKGRDKEIQQLLQTDGATAITQAIYGLGGIGKSRLAVEIGWHSVNTGQYKAVLFVVSDSPTVLKTNLAKLTEKLSLPEKNEKEQELQYEAVLNWFEKNDKWLLIFDNVDIDKAAEAVIVILKHLSRGRVLITSRRRGWPAAIHPLPLDKLNENDAIRFLMERTNSRIKTNHDEADAQRLAKLLDGLPLALEQAAAYIDANGCIFSDYLKDWEKNRDKILCWYDKSSGVPISVAITWNRTWDMLSPGARTLLRLISFLAPEPIPIDFLKKSEKAIIKSCKLLELKEKKINKIVISAIISELVRYSMIDREENSISVHRIVQEVIRMNIPKKQQHNWVLAILNMVNDYFPKDPPPNDVRSWNLWIPMQSHVSKIAHESDQHKINSPTSRLMNELSLFFLSRANYLEAEPLMRRALAIEEASLGAEYPKVATALNNLALLLQATNRLQEAEPLMRRALAIDE
ncbi:MAG: tetratricopeptide repeat protein, partial [bacterium]